MDEYKHIETCIGNYIAENYNSAVEVGIGSNTKAADTILAAGKRIRCTDVKEGLPVKHLDFSIDDIFKPTIAVFEQADVIYSIRPAIEMIPPMISLAKKVNADLLIYHLGFELYEKGGDPIDCGVLLHRYYQRLNPSKRVT